MSIHIFMYLIKKKNVFLAGPLCLRERKGFDRRLDDNFLTFKEFNRSLDMRCESGEYKFIVSFVFTIK